MNINNNMKKSVYNLLSMVHGYYTMLIQMK